MKRSLLFCAVFIFCITGISLAQERIVVAGTGDSQELLRVLANAFEKVNPGKKVEVPYSVGSSGGIRLVREGGCDLGRLARPLNDKEKKYGLNYEVFAYSPVALAVNPGVKGIDNIVPEQIVGIFSGVITSWGELGGQKQKIYVVQREKGDSSRIMLEANIPGWKEIKDLSGEVVYTTPEMVSALVEHQDSIGYLPLSMAKSSGLTVLRIGGVYPSVENVKNGTYKLTIPFSLIWKGELEGLARTFVDFILSPEGQGIIAENGAVPVK
ncbi:MAG: substrate-binding domain-containing protein [Candidatus Omnitrophica bacterium]|nr:substrate-binding domain-containing protein [Candidatus Omnitrophota bacterium]